MEENRNMEIKDEMMDQVTGGVINVEDLTDTVFFGTVVKYLGDQKYLVRLRDGGQEITGIFTENHILEEGKEVWLATFIESSESIGWEINEII